MGVRILNSIGSKLIIRTIMIITIIMIAAGSFIIFQLNKSMSNNLEEKFVRTQKQLDLAMRSPVWNYNNDQIVEIFQSYLEDPDILSIRMENSYNDIIYLGKDYKTGEIIDLKGTFVEIYPEDIVFNPKVDKNFYIRDGAVYLAMVTLEFSQEIYLQQFRIVRLYVLVITLFLILFETLLLVYLVQRHITTPLNSAVDAAKEISKSNFNIKLEDNHNDEIGSLYQNLKSMSSQLKSSFSKIENQREELKLLNHELEKRVLRRTKELNESNESLKNTVETLKITQKRLVESEKIAALGTLVQGIAHEINTPVGIGVTAATHLESETKEIHQKFEEGNLKKKVLDDYLKIAEETSSLLYEVLNRSANLINSFKMISIDEFDKYKVSLNIKVYIRDVLLSYQDSLSSNNITLVFNCPEDIYIEQYPQVFSQIISGLLENSIIHGFKNKSKGNINIEIKKNEDTLEIKYQDDGEGMTKEVFEHIYEPFFTTARGSGNIGLGLHIIYNLISQALGGSVKCTSNKGFGTFFNITMPL